MKLFIHIAMIFFILPVSAQNWRDTLDMARDAYGNKDYTKALEYYESAQKGAPDNVDLSDEMAQSAYKAREFDRAEEIYSHSNKAKKSESQKADNFHNLGNSRMKKKDYSGAIEAYKEALRNNPNDDETRYNLSEAIRQLKNEQKQKQNNNQNQNNQNQNNQNKNQNNNQNQDSSENKGKEGQNQLENKMVDKMLDKLMKAEAETKRKMYGAKGKNSVPRSGKDW